MTLALLLFWICFFLLTPVFVLQWFLSIRKFWSQFVDFPSGSKEDATFHCTAYDYSHADWDSLHDHLRDVPWEDIFKLGASAATTEFCEWVQVAIDVYIPRRKYQVKPHSFPCFSDACAATIAHRNHFFHLYQQNKFSTSQVKLQASNHCQNALEAVKDSRV